MRDKKASQHKNYTRKPEQDPSGSQPADFLHD